MNDESRIAERERFQAETPMPNPDRPRRHSPLTGIGSDSLSLVSVPSSPNFFPVVSCAPPYSPALLLARTLPSQRTTHHAV